MFRKNTLSMAAAIVLMGTMSVSARAQFERDAVFSEQLQKNWMETVVRIKAEKGEYVSQGTGVCVAHDERTGVSIILTAAHVVQGAKSVSFEVFTAASYPNPARKYSPAAKWWWNEKDDVAVIITRIWVPRTARLATDPTAIRKDDHVFSLGCGFGAPPAAVVGDVAGFDESGDYIVDRGGVGGRSGGPLIGRQGLIGILSRGRNGETYFVSLDKINRFIERTAANLQSFR